MRDILNFNTANLETLITICARGGSKGIPAKNIKILAGLPLIAYSIETAKRYCKKHRADLTLSTDSDEIKLIASKYGLITKYSRPAYLAADKAGKIDVIKEVLLFEEMEKSKSYDYIVDLDVTSPLRNLKDLEEAMKILLKNKEANNIVSVSPANRNPYFNMIEVGKNGFIKLIKSDKLIKTRQDAPIVYDMNASFYIYRRQFFNEGWETTITTKSLAYIVPHVCFDLDHPIDFKLMDILISEKLLDFKL